ncbi:hypothetical protein CRE_22038 [Caenorhabditis remanei]|uniref:F-box domain-containing protein n=1 Tax=Caenorhabditis remanei TaxID=31234 RepID=E3N3H9_CAERE|nr:hypothetical protein CRE_22038 [Caenorhabditis remanei]
MSSPFPLLRLPRLVLFDVFKSLDVDEKIKLSLCSKKISTQINNAQFYSQKVIVDLDILDQNIKVHSENDQDIFEIFTYPDSGVSQNSDKQQFYIAGCSVTVNSTPTGIKIFWKNHQERTLESYLVPGFKPVFISWPQKITNWSSYFFTLEHLLACTCTTITLWNSHLGDKDVDEILRKWKAGRFPYLEYLSIEGESISNRWILGMYQVQLQGMVIQTDDGSKKATINTGCERIEICVTPFD